MANQWGRDSQLPSNRGAGGTIIAVLVALSLGAAASYGYMRFAQPDQSAQVSELTAENDLLQQSLHEAQTKLEQNAASLAEAEKARTAAENAVRQREAAEADGNSEVAELQKRLAEQAKELDRLTEQLAAASNSDATASAQEMTAQNQQLTAKLQQVQAQVRSVEAERDRLEKELAASRQDGQASAAATGRELDELRQSVVPQLRAEIERLQQQAKALNAEKSQLQAGLETLQAQANADRAARAQLDDELRVARARVAELERQLAAQTADIQAATPAPQNETPAEKPATPSARSPRDPSEVDNALRRAPGLTTLSSDQETRLRSALVDGACVTDALDAAFDRVPVITLRNLIRDLNSDC
ncbi:hypothetical protein SAMN05880593_104204 [Rhizobium sp. RU36D]|nr:hypothetical protein SAMN05880593_104204 [Rhizobium sp. RU36D]